MGTPGKATAPVVETVWLEQIVAVDSKELPGGSKTLLLTMANGRRYAIPLIGAIGQQIQRHASPVAIATKLPSSNGHGV